MNAKHLIVVGASALLFGCTPGASPVLDSASARIARTEGETAVLAVAVGARNPGTVALSLREVHYEVLVGGRGVFSGVRSAEATLGRFAERELNLPAPIAGEVRPGETFTVRGTLLYLPEGAAQGVLYDAGLINPGVGFQLSGRIAE